MKKLYEKNELTFALVWIVVYCVLQSLTNPLNKAIGIEYAASAAFCLLHCIVLFIFIQKNNLQKRYGLCKSPVPARRSIWPVAATPTPTRAAGERPCASTTALAALHTVVRMGVS